MRPIPHGHGAIAALLVQKTEPRVLLFELLQGSQRLGYPVQASLVGGDQVQGIAVPRCSNRKRLGRGERFNVPATLA